MLKKLLATTLSILMLISSISAFAALSAAGDFTTTAGTIDKDTSGIAVDNFDSRTETALFKTYTSDVFYPAGNSTQKMSIVSKDNSDGADKVLQIVEDGRMRPASLKFYIQQNYKTVFSYDVRITQLPTGNKQRFLGAITYYKDASSTKTAAPLQIVYNSESSADFKNVNYATTKAVTQNKWYRVTCVASYDSSKNEGSRGVYIVYLTDKETGEIELSADALVDERYGAAYINPVFTDTTTGCTSTMQIDNAELAVYNETQYAPGIKTNSIATAGNEISGDVKSATVVFDQPISTLGTATITTPQGATIECSVASVSTKLNTYTISWEDALVGGDGYKLTLAGFKNGSGTAGGGEITFNVLGAPTLATSTIVSGAQNVSASTKTVDITFSKNVTAPAAVVVSGGSADIEAVVSGSGNSYTLTWSEELEGSTQYTIDLAGFRSGSFSCENTIVFTTEFTGIVKVSDDFETDGVSKYGYNCNNEKNVALTTGEAQQDGFVSRVSGYNGIGYALQLSTGGNQANKGVQPLKTTVALTPDSKEIGGANVYEQFVVTYRFNLKDCADINTNTTFSSKDTKQATTAGTDIYFYAEKTGTLSRDSAVANIRSNEDGAYIYAYGVEKAPITPINTNHWYNIVLTIDGTNQTFTLIDAEPTSATKGNVIWSGSKEVSTYNAGDAIYVTPCYSSRYRSGNYMYNENQTVLIDDFTVTRVKPWVSTNKLTVTTEDEVNDFALDGEIAMTFNQPVIASNNAIALYSGEPVGEAGALENTEVPTTVTYKYPDFNMMTASFTNLNYATSYTVDYSGLVSSASSLITLNTMSDPSEVVVISDINCTGLGMNDKVTFNLASKAAKTPLAIVAFYKGDNFVGAEMRDVNVSVSESNSAEVTLTKAYDADSIRVFVWDGLSTLKPLAKAKPYIIVK